MLPRTTLIGRVTVEGASDPGLVELRFQGDAQSTFTDREGKYRLAGVESGPQRVLLVSYRGLQGSIENVTIPYPGFVATRDLNVVANASGLTVS